MPGADTPRNNGDVTVGRDAKGRFASGNPGRPPGARHKSTVAMEALLDGEAEALTRKVVELALEGDTTALRLCLERLSPPRKDTPIRFELPEVATPRDVVAASSAILEAVATGELTPSEAQAVGALLQAHSRTLELNDLELRLQRLEEERQS